MAKTFDYASKDLKRRPFRTSIMLITLTTVVAMTTFLFLFANLLLDVTHFVTATGMRRTLSIFFESFIWTILIVVFLLALVVFSSLASLEMVSRRKDIGLMKSIGTLIDTVFDHFMAQAVILLLTSVALGVSIGTLLYLGGTFWLSTVVTGLRFEQSFPMVQICIIALLYVFVGYFAAQKPIYDAVQEFPAATLNPQLKTNVRTVGLLDTFGLSFRIAAKASGRKIKGSRRVLLSLFLSISLASLLSIGGGIVETTTNSYITRSMGTNIIAVGAPEVLSNYYSAYSLSGSPLSSNISFVNASYFIPSGLVASLNNQYSVVRVEMRFIECTTVQEGPGIIWNPTLEQWERIGDDRTGTALIVGVNWQDTISNWYYEGDPINDTNQVWIGGTLATTLFDDPLIQTLHVQGVAFDIRAILFDLVNGGMVAFMDLKTMEALWGVSTGNLLLVQLERYDETVISQISQLAHSYGLDIYRQQEVLEENLSTISSIWSLLQPLTIIALLSTFLSLTNYLMVSVFDRFRDYLIMQSIGANPFFIAKTMIAEGAILGLKAGVPGILASIIFAGYFLVPEAAVGTILYLPASFVLMLGALLFVTILSAIPVYYLFKSRRNLHVAEFSV